MPSLRIFLTPKFCKQNLKLKFIELFCFFDNLSYGFLFSFSISHLIFIFDSYKFT